MTTSITINSLQRFDYEKETTKEGNPFNFTLSPSTTSNWIFKRRPFSRTALTKVTDAFSVKICRVFIPKAIVPEQQSLLFLQVEVNPGMLIDKQIGPHIKATNNFEGITGNCTPYPENFTSYNNVWTLYPANPRETPTHWVYDSCTDVSINNDWKARTLHFTVRDSLGYELVPPFYPANGITGFTSICDFKPICAGASGISGCKPYKSSKCCPTASQISAYNKLVCAENSKLCFPDPVYFPFFQANNQVMIILSVTYMDAQNDALGLEECFE